MKKRVYLETTIVSYLTAWPSRDLIRVARHEITRERWESRRGDFELYVSELVTTEAARGDEVAAQRRLAALEGIALLEIVDEVADLAEALIADGPMPEAAADDAVHLAVATVHGVDLLLTWNCRHLANAEWTEQVADLLRSKGYRPPVVCTPEELMGG